MLNARGQSRLARRDIAHGREQHWIQRDACAQAEQQHAWQHIGHEMPVDRGACKYRKTQRGEQQARREWPAYAEAHYELG